MAIDLTLLRDNFNNNETVTHWIPHPLMPSDMMTKSDVQKGNAALANLLRTGRWQLLDEKVEMSKRKATKKKPGRSKAASAVELKNLSGQSSDAQVSRKASVQFSDLELIENSRVL